MKILQMMPIDNRFSVWACVSEPIRILGLALVERADGKTSIGYIVVNRETLEICIGDTYYTDIYANERG